MRRTNLNLTICAMVFAVALVISNVVTAKTVQTGIPLFGSTILVPSAVFCYAITFLMTDIIGEIWGKKEAKTVVYIGFGCQVMACILIIIAQALPAASPEMQASYDMLLGQNIVFVIASLAGYMVSQTWDVFVFHKIRSRVMANHGGSNSRRWIWNNVSTMTSQMFDTVIFIGIAFGLGSGWLFDAEMLPTLSAMMVGQYLLKFVLAAIDTPFFYFFTRKSGRRSGELTDEFGNGDDGSLSKQADSGAAAAAVSAFASTEGFSDAAPHRA